MFGERRSLVPKCRSERVDVLLAPRQPRSRPRADEAVADGYCVEERTKRVRDGVWVLLFLFVTSRPAASGAAATGPTRAGRRAAAAPPA